MSLLSPGQKASIRAAIKSVTDTFMVSGIEFYTRQIAPNLWQEKRSSNEFLRFNLSGLVEYPVSKTTETISGAVDLFDIKVTFNTADLIAANAVGMPEEEPQIPAFDVVANKCIFEANDDYFFVAGEKYRASFVGYDGPLDAQPVLVVIRGRLFGREVV